ncbi:hypothetical protein SAM19_02734 [Brevibacillus laterosporus]|nr:hypothetical protein [Brevibacillus laterosporus]
MVGYGSLLKREVIIGIALSDLPTEINKDLIVHEAVETFYNVSLGGSSVIYDCCCP